MILKVHYFYHSCVKEKKSNLPKMLSLFHTKSHPPIAKSQKSRKNNDVPQYYEKVFRFKR
jgi:hypothetical protein